MPPTFDITSCVRARLSLSLALDGEAGGPELYETAMHLGRCGPCREFAARLGAITAALRASGRGSREQRQPIARGAGS